MHAARSKAAAKITKTPKLEQTQLTRECWQALDHLRNALDLTPQHSRRAYVLLESIRQLAAFIDSTQERQSDR